MYGNVGAQRPSQPVATGSTCMAEASMLQAGRRWAACLQAIPTQAPTSHLLGPQPRRTRSQQQVPHWGWCPHHHRLPTYLPACMGTCSGAAPRHARPRGKPHPAPAPPWPTSHESCIMSHASPCLHKLQRLEGQLAKHVGVAVKQHVPEVVHLARARDHVRQLLVVHKPTQCTPRSGSGAPACTCTCSKQSCQPSATATTVPGALQSPLGPLRGV